MPSLPGEILPPLLHEACTRAQPEESANDGSRAHSEDELAQMRVLTKDEAAGRKKIAADCQGANSRLAARDADPTARRNRAWGLSTSAMLYPSIVSSCPLS